MDSHFLKTVFSLVSKEGIGLCVCYAVILLAATFGGQLGTSVPILPQNNTFLSPPSPSPPPSTQVSYALDFVSVGYLFFCYICFFVHVIFPFRAMSIIRVGWSAVVVLSGIMLIGLYVYQFPLVYMWVSQTFQKTLLAKCTYKKQTKITNFFCRFFSRTFWVTSSPSTTYIVIFNSSIFSFFGFGIVRTYSRFCDFSL